MSIVHVIGALGWTLQGGVLIALALSRLVTGREAGAEDAFAPRASR